MAASANGTMRSLAPVHTGAVFVNCAAMAMTSAARICSFSTGLTSRPEATQ
jgi:hypothetical protein